MSPCIELVWGIATGTSKSYADTISGAMQRLKGWNADRSVVSLGNLVGMDESLRGPTSASNIPLPDYNTSLEEAAPLFRLAYRSQGKYDAGLWFWEDVEGRRRYQL